MLLSGKSLKHDFIRFATATVASQMVFSLYSMVDGLMVSIGVNEYAMSAVNLVIPFTNALFSVAVLFGVGSSTLIAFCLAQQKRQEADTIFSQNIVTLGVIGVTVSVLVLTQLEAFARLLGADDITMDYVRQYLSGLAPFSVCYLISYNLEVLIKTDGYPRYALCTVIVSCLTNCILDYIAIFRLDMGVFGAAVATGISQLVTCISYMIHFSSDRCTFRLRRFRFDIRIYEKVIPLGLSDGVTELCVGLMIFLFNHIVLSCIGTDGVVIYTVIAYVSTLVGSQMVGLSQGMQPLVSYQYGRKDSAACGCLLRYAITAVCIIAPVLLAVLLLFTPQLVRTYLPHAGDEIVGRAVYALRRYSISYLLIGFNIVIGGFMTAVQRPVSAVCIAVGRGLVLQSAALLLLAGVFGGEAVWYTPIISEAASLVMSLYFLRRYQLEAKKL